MNENSEVLPHSADVEECVVGSLFLDPDIVAPLVDTFPRESWYIPAFAEIASVALSLWADQKPVTMGTVCERLTAKGRLEAVGGAAAIVDAVTKGARGAAATEYNLTSMREKAAMRIAVIEARECERLARNAGNAPEEIADQFETAAAAVRAMTTDPTQNQKWSVKDAVFEVIDGFEKAYERRGEIMGVATGIRKLDLLLGGLQASDMIVIAARPSVGKTAIAMNIAEHVAVDLKRPVGIFSLEMSRQQLLSRLVCSRARANLQSVRDGFASERDFPNLSDAATEIAAAPLQIDDTSSVSINDLKAKARQMHKISGGLALVVIDYLQLMRSTTRRGQENRQLEITEISAGIKGLAKELNIPIIVAAQLNRQPENRAGGRPKLSDLRESGAIEQDADVVALLYRPEMNAADEKEKESLAGQAELDIAKQRNGPVGEIPLTFLKHYSRFTDRAKEAA